MEAMKYAHRKIYCGGRHAQLRVSPEIVEVGMEQLVEDLSSGVHRVHVTDPGPVSRSTVELVDVRRSQAGLHVVRDPGWVHPGESPNREFLGLLAEGGPGVEQRVEQLSLLRRRQGVQCRSSCRHGSSTRWSWLPRQAPSDALPLARTIRKPALGSSTGSRFVAGNLSRMGKPSVAALDALIEEATVDCVDEDEQVLGLYTMMVDELNVPFPTVVLGVEVIVEGLDMTGRWHIVAHCSRGGFRQAISVLELPLPTPPPAGAQWIEAYRRWAA